MLCLCLVSSAHKGAALAEGAGTDPSSARPVPEVIAHAQRFSAREGSPTPTRNRGALEFERVNHVHRFVPRGSALSSAVCPFATVQALKQLMACTLGMPDRVHEMRLFGKGSAPAFASGTAGAT